MTENIGLRLRFDDLFIIVAPSSGDSFSITVTDVWGRAPDDDIKRRRALQYLLRALSDLRGQVWEMLGAEILT